MKRLDICQAQGPGLAGKDRLVVVLQHHHCDDLATVIVAPLFRPDELPKVARLRPQITHQRKSFLVAVDRMSAIPKRQLGVPVATADKLHFEISDAISRLFTGF